MFADEEFVATMRAGVQWARERDIPDPVAWADLLHAPPVTLRVIRARLDEGVAPTKSHTLPFPKGVAGELRQMTVADPFDEVVFRALVGRAASAIDDALGEEVTSYRLITPAPGWTVRDYRYAQGLRTDELDDRVASQDFGGLGTLDIRNYYPSIDVAQLGSVLLSAGVDPGVAEPIVDYLSTWHRLWGVQGVPIGLEASGLLGNVYLLPVDNALHAAGVKFGRYTDDYRLWLSGAETWAVARDVVAEAVAALGLQLNPNKTRHLSTPHGARRELTNGDITTLKALLETTPDAGLEATLDHFDAEVAKSSPDPKRLKFFLGVLKTRCHPHALAAAQCRVELLQADPKAWAAYLKTLHRHGRLDLDWLLEVVTAPVTKYTAAVTYHLLKVCVVRRVGREHGRRLGEFATDNDRTWVPVRCAAAEAWSTSDGYKATNAADAALAVGDAQQRRALVLSMRRSSASPARDKALAQLHQAVPECRPTVRWIRESCDRAA